MTDLPVGDDAALEPDVPDTILEQPAAPAVPADEPAQQPLFVADAPAADWDEDAGVTYGVPEGGLPPSAAVPEEAFIDPEATAVFTADDLDAIRAELGGAVDQALPVEEALAAATPPSEEPSTDDEGEPADAGEQTELDTGAEDDAEPASEDATSEKPAEDADEESLAAAVPVAEPAPAPVVIAPARAGSRLLSVPFLVYLGIWFCFSVAMVIVLRPAALAGTLDTASQYPMFLVGGLVLTVVGPVLALFLWALAWWGAPKGERKGLLSTALLRGALATIAGVFMWYGAIFFLNYLKTGRFY